MQDRYSIRVGLLVSVSLTSVLAGLAVAACAGPGTGPADGSRLYARHCAVCHGVDGEGDGPASEYLAPAPRDLTGRDFALVSAVGGQPGRAELERLLVRGMPGSAMPSFAFLDESDRGALVEYLLEIRAPNELPRLETIDEPPRSGADGSSLARGGELYAARCAACHGPEGRGGIVAVPHGVDGRVYEPARDFTAGILRGPVTRIEIARRIVAGMPSSGMPGNGDLSAEDLGLLVDHVMRMIPPSASEAFVQTSRELQVARVDELPETADDQRFPTPVSMVLAPLAWSEGAIRRVEVSGVHDGRRLLLRLHWADPTADDRVVGGASSSPDGVAVQWSDADEPPLLSMGSDRWPVEVWHWQAFRPDEIAGYLDALESSRSSPHDVFRAPAPGVLATDQRARGGVAAGPPSRGTFAGRRAEVSARAEYVDGHWTVVLERPLSPPNDGMIDLAGSRKFWLACAVWNGSAFEQRGHKSVSTWQAVRLGG